MKKLFFIFFTFFIFFIFFKFNYSKNINIENIKSGDIFLENPINVILKDENDFIWIGTKKGLIRYDGYNFKLFYYEIDKKNEKNNIYSMHIEENFIYIGSEKGLILFDILKEEYTEKYIDKKISEMTIFKIYKIDDKQFWLINNNNGIYLLNLKEENNKINENIDIQFDYIFDNIINCVYKSEKGKIYIGSKKGLSIYNQFNKKIESVLSEKEILDIKFYKKDKILLLTSKNEIIVYDKVLNSKNVIDIKSILKTDEVINFTKFDIDEKGDIWIGTWNKGLIKYNIDENTLEECKEKNCVSEIVKEIFIDENNNVWIGTKQSGLKVYFSFKNKFFTLKKFNEDNIEKYGKITSIFERNEKEVWVGHLNSGITILDNKSHKLLSRINIQKEIDKKDGIFDIYFENEETAWIATYENGLAKYEINKNKLEYYKDNENGFCASKNMVYNILKNKNGEIFAGTYFSGINISEDGKKFKNYSIKTENTLNDNSINVIFEDSEKNIWIGTDKGVNIFDIDKKEFISLEAIERNTIISSITEDIEKNIWIGTINQGIIKYDKKQKKVKKISKEDGLEVENICGIIPDNKNNLWISTLKNIIKYDIIRKKSKIYGEKDGIDVSQFYWGAFHKGKSGNFYFGGNDALVYFNPDNIDENKEKEKLKITSFKIFNNEIKGASYINEINLKENYNFLTIEFAIMNYKNSNENIYFYKIDKMNNFFKIKNKKNQQWIDIGSRNYINFSNLSPGKYNLIIRGKNKSNDEMDDEIKIRINVLPLFWKSIYAKMIYILFFIMSVTAYIFLFIRSLKEKHLKKEKYILEVQNKSKTEFFSNMSHEIRVPMYGIMGAVNLIEETELNNYQKKYFEVIKHSSERLVKLTSDILDFSKMEENKMKLENLPFSLKNLIEDTKILFEPKFFQKDIDLKMEYDENIPDYIGGDPVRVNQVLNNLINNALKFTEKGYIKLYIDLKEKNKENIKINFCLEDTGIGLSEEQIKNIIQRYEQGDRETYRKYGGTGLGLSISNELINLMGGNLSIKSEKNKGSFFYFELNFSTVEKYEEYKYEEKKEVDIKRIEANILVLDDDDISGMITKELINQIIEKHNYVDFAKDYKEAFEQMKNKKYDILISDMQLENINGIEFAEILRKNKIDIKIIIVSGMIMTEHENKMKELKISGNLLKPVNKEELLHKIWETLNKEKYPQWYLLIKDDKEKLENIMRNFEKSIKEFSYKIKEAIKNENETEYQKVLHKISGTIGFMEIEKLNNMLQELKDIKKIKENKHNISEKVEKFIDEMEKFLRLNLT